MTKKNLIKICLLILTVSAVALVANVVLAQNPGTFQTYQDFLNKAGREGTYNVDLQSDESYFDTLLGRIIMTVISFTGLFFLGLVIYSGFQWMTAGGNEEKVEQAKKRILNGVIGVAITLLAFILTYALYSYFDQRFLKDPGTGIETPPTGEEPYQISCDELNNDGANGRFACVNNPRVCDGQDGIIIDAEDASCPNQATCCFYENTPCPDFNDRGLCIANLCFWEFTGPRTGICLADSACRTSCNPNVKYCIDGECKECQDDGDCAPGRCVNNECQP
ncbi:MAG: pilin [Candidatus Komeilibacteria bacterium]|nr:pilin [Candidatus Komeilibacteria bacterium]